MKTESIRDQDPSRSAREAQKTKEYYLAVFAARRRCHEIDPPRFAHRDKDQQSEAAAA